MAAEVPKGFAVELELPNGTASDLRAAAAAIVAEHRGAAERIPMTALHVAKSQSDGIYCVSVDDVGDLDEGGTAYFRPPENSSASWEAHIVAVDEIRGHLYLAMTNPERVPDLGDFTVQPFDFLRVLKNLYVDDDVPEAIATRLASRLLATRGQIHPRLSNPSSMHAEYCALWAHGWAAIWGPPGTGKTYTLGRLAAAALQSSDERVLIISTTNKATDEAALSCVDGMRELQADIELAPRIIRIGSGAGFAPYQRKNAVEVLAGGEVHLRHKLDQLRRRHSATTEAGSRATIMAQIHKLREEMRSATMEAVCDDAHQLVVSTLFGANQLLGDSLILDLLAHSEAPFTTVVIDEAGLVSRAAVAAISLLASRRVILVGDPRQLSPISKMARILNSNEATWLAQSGLGHLRSALHCNDAVLMLNTQYRMAPTIRRAVSKLTYDNQLRDAPAIADRPVPCDLTKLPGRAIWYVLDEGLPKNPVRWRASRGPGAKSWVRPIAEDILQRIFAAHPDIAQATGLFVTPFVAQAQAIAICLGTHAPTWTASTIHRQQGAEYDVVIFDTVNASGNSWSYEEWLRLVNVGISRARHQLFVLSSRDEMASSFLAPLAAELTPATLNEGFHWQIAAPVQHPDAAPAHRKATANPDALGAQLHRQRSIRPVLSADQERLCHLEMDGKPRLVRGVAGSGKTLVLANWLVQLLLRYKEQLPGKLWVVYGNRSLEGLLRSALQTAWPRDLVLGPLPWERVELLHIRDLFKNLFADIEAPFPEIWGYDELTQAYYQRNPAENIVPRCDALFVDEAQDMGHDTMDLLIRLTRTVSHKNGRGKAIHIFYDNAQNLYRRTHPKWLDLGLDMRGRSTVLKESYRSTRPITEYALNLLYYLRDPSAQEDYKELLKRGLITAHTDGQRPWWQIFFNSIEGPMPEMRVCQHRAQECQIIAASVARTIRDEGVSPDDIGILYINDEFAKALSRELHRTLQPLGVRVSRQTSQREFTRLSDTVLLTTPHSFKGYEAEVVYVVNLAGYAAASRIFAESLYVAMTRARSILKMTGHTDDGGQSAELVRSAHTLLKYLETVSRG